MKEFENLLGIEFGNKKPRIIYFPIFRDFYLHKLDLCIANTKEDLRGILHELGHAYTNRVNPELFNNSFLNDPRKVLISRMVSEGIAEWISINALLKHNERSKILAEKRQKQLYWKNADFLNKAAFVFKHEAGEIIHAENKIKMIKLLLKYIKNMEFAFYYLGYNFVYKQINEYGKTLEEVIKSPPQNLEEIRQFFEIK